MPPLQTAYEKGFAQGEAEGRRDALTQWLGQDAPVTRDARLATLAIEVDRLDLSLRTYPAGIAILTGEPRSVRPTRASVLEALRHGIYCGRKDENVAAIPFIQERLLPIVREGEWFDFGELHYMSLGDSDWRPFAEAGLIKLPFPRVTFRVSLDPRRIAQIDSRLEIVWSAEQDDAGAISILGLFVNGERGLGVTGFHRYDRATLQAHKLTFRDHINHLFFALWLVLNTKGVAQERIEPSEKLNRARAKTGKTLLQPYVKIDTVTYINARRETERMEAAGFGHHASPRPHLRRAHLRRLQSGIIVPVMATIVNGTADVKASAREKYVVKLPATQETP